jgi:hypothetical protein
MTLLAIDIPVLQAFTQVKVEWFRGKSKHEIQGAFELN